MGNSIRRKDRTSILGFDLPTWVGRMLSAFGMTAILYGHIRYTFIGEWLEYLFQDMTGHAPVDGFTGGLTYDRMEPPAMEQERDYDVMKDEMRTSEE